MTQPSYSAGSVPASVFGTDVMPTPPSVARERRVSLQWHRLNFGGQLLARRAGERETLFLMLVCALDMYTTLWWVVTGYAREANPWLAWTFNHHPVWFVVVKAASCLPALLFAPLLARKHPVFTVWLLRAVIVAYIGYYLLNVQ